MATVKLFPFPDNRLNNIVSGATYTYRTGSVYLLNIMDTIPHIEQIGIFLYNASPYDVTITPIMNVFPNQMFPDAPLSTTLTVNTGTSGLLAIPSDEIATNFISISITAGTTQNTIGTNYLEGFATINYAYTTS
jgi:hypothetical protein